MFFIFFIQFVFYDYTVSYLVTDPRSYLKNNVINYALNMIILYFSENRELYTYTCWIQEGFGV